MGNFRLCICGWVIPKNMKFCSDKCRKRNDEIDKEFWCNIGDILGYEIDKDGKSTGVINCKKEKNRN